MAPLNLAVDYNAFRKALVKEIQLVTGLDQFHVILEEPETQDAPRPTKPYMSFKVTTVGVKQGDDDKRLIYDTTQNPPVPTNQWNSGGQRRITVGFNAYGRTHEEAYNYMEVWRSALDLDTVQQDLRSAQPQSIAVVLMETIADVSQLLNTGYEGRAHLDVIFGVAANLVETLGEMDTAPIAGTVETDSGVVTIDETLDIE
jgi:hypothetical protein